MQPARNIHIDLAAELASAHVAIAAGQLQLLAVVARCLASEVWRSDGSQDLSDWLACHLGMSRWAARRWIHAAVTLPHLPLVSDALASGRLNLDKVLELCRFATPETEKGLVAWARRVTVRSVRHKADLEKRPCLDEVQEAHRARFLNYWWSDDGTSLGLYGSLPADMGATFVNALDRLADRAPDIIECHCADDSSECDCAPSPPEESIDVRRADALVAMASAQIADDHDPDRASVVVHADLGALVADERHCELEQGPVIHPETARRLCCDARIQLTLHDPEGTVVGIGRMSRTVPQALLRQLRRRDRGCTFPGCEARRFLHAHHIWHWILGGPTDLGNLILVCPYHHSLVHEHRWRVELNANQPAWFRPNGRRFEPLADALEELLERGPPVLALP